MTNRDDGYLGDDPYDQGRAERRDRYGVTDRHAGQGRMDSGERHWSGYGTGQDMPDDQGSYGERYGLGYGAGDRTSGYADQFGGLRYGGRAPLNDDRPGGMMTGSHYGRGPRNYQRSDDRIREDINEHLTYHHEIDASDIDVQVQNGEVTLSGTVADRSAKRLAEDLAERVRGVRDVHNQLKVNGGLLSNISDMLGIGDDKGSANR